MRARSRWIIAAAFWVSWLPPFAQQLPQAAQTSYSIRGVVVSAKSGKPLDRAAVTLYAVDSATQQSGAKIADVTTGEDGTFDFEHLHAGKYNLRAARRGYDAASYDEHEGFYAAVVAGPGLDTSDVRFPLLPAAVISGTVTDDAGDPVRNAGVVLYRKYSFDGLGKITQAASQQTNDIGEFEFARLAPGDYFASVSATPWYATRPQPRRDAQGNPITESQPERSPLDVAYPLTFYPDTDDADSATPIPVRPGDHVQVNFSLRAQPAVHLYLRIPEADQKRGFMFPQITQNLFGQQAAVQIAGGSISPGLAEISGLAPGRYELHFPGANGWMSSESDIDLAADTTIDGPAADPGVEITGKIETTNGEAPPGPIYVLFRDASNTYHQAGNTAKDGTFKLDSIAAGTYDMLVNGPGARYSVVSMSADGASVDGRQIKVGSNPVNLALVITQSSAALEGYASKNGKPAEGAMIVLVPRNPGANLELFRRDESNTDGSFVLLNVAPGAYTLVAIEDGWQIDWARPEVIARYLPRGVRVEVGLAQKTINLGVPVEAQPH